MRTATGLASSRFSRIRAQILCGSREGRPGLPRPLVVLMVSAVVKQHSKKLFTEHRSCVKVERAVLGSPSLTVLMVSADVRQH